MPNPEIYLREIPRDYTQNVILVPGQAVAVNRFFGIKMRRQEVFGDNKVNLAISAPRDVPILSDKFLDGSVTPRNIQNPVDGIGTVNKYFKSGQESQIIYVGSEVMVSIDKITATGIALGISSASPLEVERLGAKEAVFVEKYVEKRNRFPLSLLRS